MEQNQNGYQTTQHNYSPQNAEAPIITVGNWIVTMIIMVIPLVNIVMLIVWATSSIENPNRKNWAIAQLIFMAIAILISIVFFGAIVGMLGGIAGSYS